MATLAQAASSISDKDHPELRKLWWVTLVVQTVLGFTNGLYLYTYGPYFYEKFGGSIEPTTAMLLTTILLGIRQALVALLEVPTGALADAIGRVQVVILSWGMRILFFVSLAAIWFCDSIGFAFGWGVIASIAFALSYALFNGSFTAWCVETLKEKAPHVNYGWLSARYYSYQSLAIAAGGVLAVWLYLHEMIFVGFLAAAFLIFCAMAYCMARMKEVQSLHFLRAHEVQFSTITRRIGEIIGRAVQICAKTPVLFWIILTYGSYMFLLNLVMYLWPVYLKSAFHADENLGLNWMLIVLSSELLRTLGSRILVRLNTKWTRDGGVERHLVGFRRIFVGSTLLSSVAILALSWDTAFHMVSSFFFPTAVMIVIIAFGIVAPCFETLVNAYIRAEDAQYRSTITSAGSMLRSILILLLAIPSGGSSGETSPIGWALPATLLLISTIVANRFMRRALTEKEGDLTLARA